MKEENRRSKSASPKVTPGPDGNGTANMIKVEKRKQEEEDGGEEDLAKRAKIGGAVAAVMADEAPAQASAESAAEGMDMGTITGDAQPIRLDDETAEPALGTESAPAPVSVSLQDEEAASEPVVEQQKLQDVVMVQPVEEVVVKQE